MSPAPLLPRPPRVPPLHLVSTAGGRSSLPTPPSLPYATRAPAHGADASPSVGRRSVGGHFGPVNTMTMCPDGRSFATGGEDGYVRINHFAPEYFEAHNKKVEESKA